MEVNKSEMQRSMDKDQDANTFPSVWYLTKKNDNGHYQISCDNNVVSKLGSRQNEFMKDCYENDENQKCYRKIKIEI